MDGIYCCYVTPDAKSCESNTNNSRILEIKYGNSPEGTHACPAHVRFMLDYTEINTVYLLRPSND